MKNHTSVLSVTILLMCLIFTGCSEDPGSEAAPIGLLEYDSVNFEPSMKGWELYSWPDRDDFNHSLLPGTNRLKTYDEVIHNRYVVHGTDSLKLLLGRLPEDEAIHWIGRDWLGRCWSEPYGDLMVPNQLIVEVITEFCKEINLELHVSGN